MVWLPPVVVWSHQRLCVPLALKAPRLMLDLFLHPSLINHLFTSHPLGSICSLFYCAPFCCFCVSMSAFLFVFSQCHEEIEIVSVVQQRIRIMPLKHTSISVCVCVWFNVRGLRAFYFPTYAHQTSYTSYKLSQCITRAKHDVNQSGC